MAFGRPTGETVDERPGRWMAVPLAGLLALTIIQASPGVRQVGGKRTVPVATASPTYPYACDTTGTFDVWEQNYAETPAETNALLGRDDSRVKTAAWDTFRRSVMNALTTNHQVDGFSVFVGAQEAADPNRTAMLAGGTEVSKLVTAAAATLNDGIGIAGGTTPAEVCSGIPDTAPGTTWISVIACPSDDTAVNYSAQVAPPPVSYFAWSPDHAVNGTTTPTAGQ